MRECFRIVFEARQPHLKRVGRFRDAIRIWRGDQLNVGKQSGSGGFSGFMSFWEEFNTYHEVYIRSSPIPDTEPWLFWSRKISRFHTQGLPLKNRLREVFYDNRVIPEDTEVDVRLRKGYSETYFFVIASIYRPLSVTVTPAHPTPF
ncbi:hypothetical protein CDAR_182511 [Caerostris darwini]|uniref:Uncharacterized protein n=1 Tax=Caerostris darwini TaxID=1538125 RepID=A0AAV4W2Q0_9ARAC|nr:hypothetical protein CDAR_182511 [Caerostris darwini]